MAEELPLVNNFFIEAFYQTGFSHVFAYIYCGIADSPREECKTWDQHFQRANGHEVIARQNRR